MLSKQQQQQQQQQQHKEYLEVGEYDRAGMTSRVSCSENFCKRLAADVLPDELIEQSVERRHNNAR